MTMFTKLRTIILLTAIMTAAATAAVRLPRLISDGMVLQRDATVKIWGWADPGEHVTVLFNGIVRHAAADARGEWQTELTMLKAGGPYTMTIAATDTQTIRDIAVGDVWVCSGQSNMELPMRRVSPIYAKEIAHAANKFIRQFAVPQRYDFTHPEADLPSGSWISADPASVLNFSAAAYFFASALYDRYHIPIGLINASLGGSPAESWISEDALKRFPAYYIEAQKFKDTTLIVRIDSSDRARSDAWYTLLHNSDSGYAAGHAPWSSPALDDSSWQVMNIPGLWSGTPLERINGVVWFRREITVTKDMTGPAAKLLLGRIVDADSVFVNGVLVGTTSYQYPPRRYDIPAGVLKEGTNVIVVRVISNSGIGGFVPEKPYMLSANGTSVDLTGAWRCKIGAVMQPLASQTFVRWKPLGLYNAMIAPLLNYRIKGAIWYQGESNAGKPLEYGELFPALIRDWRMKWREGDFPFLYVQLPNFMEAKDRPSQSNWALLREAQLKTLSVPNTGMAVAIDIGEWNDIHPLNKKMVGMRLALAARKLAYGEASITSSGPIFTAMKVLRNKAILSFSNIGGGLKAHGGTALNGFAIADSTGAFVFAQAMISNNTVIVWQDGIAHPAAVRYAWADNPAGANLYNTAGLPASPFRTDTWNDK